MIERWDLILAVLVIFSIPSCTSEPVGNKPSTGSSNQVQYIISEDTAIDTQLAKDMALGRLAEIQRSLRMMLMVTSTSVFQDQSLSHDKAFDDDFNRLSVRIVDLFAESATTSMARDFVPNIDLDITYMSSQINEIESERDRLWRLLIEQNRDIGSFSKIYSPAK